jgi:ankyrin repeat protein
MHGKTALHEAAEHDEADVVEALINAGADIDARTDWGATPLDWAGVLGSRAAADVLIAHGARLTLESASGLGIDHEITGDPTAAFVLACRNGHTTIACRLLEHGADINGRGFFNAPALHWAAINGHADTVRFLLERGADPTLKDDEFDSDALGWAREGGHEKVTALLELS